MVNLPNAINSTNIAEVMNIFHQMCSNNEEILIPFHNLEDVAPIGFALFIGTIASESSLGKRIYFTRPENPQFIQICQEIGFDKLIGFDRFNINTSQISLDTDWKSNIPIKLFNTSDPIDQSFIDRVISLLKNEITINENTIKSLKMALFELFRNVNDHSRSTFYFALAKCYPETKQIKITVADNGYGFFNSLHPRYPTRVLNQIDAIESSVEEGISSQSTISNAGMGLCAIRQIIESGKGRLDIISHNGVGSFLSGTPFSGNISNYNFSGTIINIEIESEISDLDYLTQDKQEEEWL